MIPASDLRKSNIIKTEHGILLVHATVWSSVMVKGDDGRVLWAKEVEGVTEQEFRTKVLPHIKLNPIIERVDKHKLGFSDKTDYLHEAQNLFYWLYREELIIEPDE